MELTDLNECFEHQIEFSRTVLKKKGIDMLDLPLSETIDWSEYTLFAIIKECCEVTGNYPWKRHRAPRVGEYNPPEIPPELVDIQKYLWNEFALWGIDTPEKFVKVFSSKSQVVLDRWAEEEDNIGSADNDF